MNVSNAINVAHTWTLLNPIWDSQNEKTREFHEIVSLSVHIWQFPCFSSNPLGIRERRPFQPEQSQREFSSKKEFLRGMKYEWGRVSPYDKVLESRTSFQMLQSSRWNVKRARRMKSHHFTLQRVCHISSYITLTHTYLLIMLKKHIIFGKRISRIGTGR